MSPAKIDKLKFKEINLEDAFFDTLKEDYDGFEEWFKRKSEAHCFIKFKERKVVGFLYLKEENEEIKLKDINLCIKNRLKIGTFKLSEEIKGTKIGEAFFNIIFKELYKNKYEEVYVTVFKKQSELIDIFKSFGFDIKGKKLNDELVLIRALFGNGDIRKCYPFISWNNNTVGKYLIIEEKWHDKLIPEGLLKGVEQGKDYNISSKGISKVYISFASNIKEIYKIGDVLAIYRKATENAAYKSAVTGLGVCEKIIEIRKNYQNIVSFKEFLTLIGNKSVFERKDLEEFYLNNRLKNITIIKFITSISFGEGNNVNYKNLKKHDLWPNYYPTNKNLEYNEILKIIEIGGSNVQNIIINKTWICRKNYKW
ncbi:MAG: GNAT family N-acetyltransferase [Mycoplasmatales bacterium]